MERPVTEALGLMCVHAHPDDEAIATGGVLASAADLGIRTAVVTCTGGELGEIVGPEMDPDEVRPRLGEVRLEELRTSLAALGAGEPRMLGYRDSGMIGTDGNDDPRSFWRADFDEAVGRLVAQIREFRPDVFVTYDAFGGYGHPDHIQAHRVSVVASEAAGMRALYPEAGDAWRVRKVYEATIPRSAIVRFNGFLQSQGLPSPFGEAVDPAQIPMGVDDEQLDAVVDVRPWLDRKRAALEAHASQVAPDSFFLNFPAEFEDIAFGSEWFVRLRSDVAVPTREDDLLGGLL